MVGVRGYRDRKSIFQCELKIYTIVIINRFELLFFKCRATTLLADTKTYWDIYAYNFSFQNKFRNLILIELTRVGHNHQGFIATPLCSNPIIIIHL